IGSFFEAKNLKRKQTSLPLKRKKKNYCESFSKTAQQNPMKNFCGFCAFEFREGRRFFPRGLIKRLCSRKDAGPFSITAKQYQPLCELHIYAGSHCLPIAAHGDEGLHPPPE
ncbi:hypothetical protein, partial [Streptomyces kanasensis]|uniref:hypothetical protein n=1 Tax=Streptomyces kanasensis TaxID=936756 RepID=UPI0012FFCD39